MPRTDGDRWMTSPDVRRLTPTGIDLSRSSRASRTSDGCHAHAGIHRISTEGHATAAALPRTRGDSPRSTRQQQTRGDHRPAISPIMVTENLSATPARAGIHRPDGRPGGASRPTRLGITRASRNPRAGADQPLVAILIERGHSPTPHPRGSTHDEELIRGHSGHRPAPAGKQPRSGVKPWHCPVHTGIDRINTGDRQSVCRPSADTNALPRVRGSSRGCAAFRVIRRRGPSQRGNRPHSAHWLRSPKHRLPRPNGDQPMSAGLPGIDRLQTRVRRVQPPAPRPGGDKPTSRAGSETPETQPRPRGDRPAMVRRWTGYPEYTGIDRLQPGGECG